MLQKHFTTHYKANFLTHSQILFAASSGETPSFSIAFESSDAIPKAA